MLLKQLMDTFKADYSLECKKRGVGEIKLTPNYILVMFSKSAGKIQRMLGVINASYTIDLLTDQNPDNAPGAFDLPQNFLQETNVLTNIPLIKMPLAWIQAQASVIGDPLYYAVSAGGNIQQIVFYPVPDVSCMATINYRMNFSVYNQTLIQFKNDLTDTNLPDEFDQALLTGMLSQMFKDLEADFEREIHLLRTSKKSAASFNDYIMR